MPRRGHPLSRSVRRRPNRTGDAAQDTAIAFAEQLVPHPKEVIGASTINRRRFALEMTLELAVPASGRGTLLEVLLAHAGGPVEVLGVDKRRRRDRRNGDHAIPDQRRARDRVRAAAGAPEQWKRS